MHRDWHRPASRRACLGGALHPGAKPVLMVEGDLIQARFRIGTCIGHGGFGVVHRAHDEVLERPVAVKEIVGGDVRRVEREAQAAARLSHPGIVTLFELARERKATYLISELVEGSTLRELLETGSVTDRDIAVIGAELCLALEHAHERGVVHRDIKPENVIVAAGDPESGTGRGQVKLMDFGIAAIAGAPTLTATGQMVGTIAYIAPELAEGRRAGPEADVYALALNLYECWAGRNPVARETPAATARSIGTRIPSLASTRPDLPARATALIDECLEPEPDARPALSELRSGLRSVERSLDPAVPVPEPTAGADGEEEPAAVHGGARNARLKVPALLGIAAVAAGLAVVGQRGTAAVIAVLAAPVVVLLPSVRAWPAPLLASILASLGLGPLYPVVAGLLARSFLERFLAGVLGVAWIAAGAVLLGTGTALDLPHATGWADSGSMALAALGEAATLQSGAFAALAGLGAAALGIVLRLRPIGLRPVVAIGWAAGMVAGYKLVRSSVFDSSGGLDGVTSAALAVCVLIAVTAATLRGDASSLRGRGGSKRSPQGAAPSASVRSRMPTTERPTAGTRPQLP